MIRKSYTLTPKQTEEVQTLLAEGAVKYDLVKDIVMESQFDAGPFFPDIPSSEQVREVLETCLEDLKAQGVVLILPPEYFR